MARSPAVPTAASSGESVAVPSTMRPDRPGEEQIDGLAVDEAPWVQRRRDELAGFRRERPARCGDRIGRAWSRVDSSKIRESMTVAVRGTDRTETGEDVPRSNATPGDPEGSDSGIASPASCRSLSKSSASLTGHHREVPQKTYIFCPDPSSRRILRTKSGSAG
uniref:Uncharacterized protein FLAS10H9.11 n=1 Tax=uncultured haloarchaeon FLAS10H9 TaxID=447098 RepID=A7U0T9_9EURY|nr:hypothetical protein [uncultured haloarchaeon FLAS10H9]